MGGLAAGLAGVRRCECVSAAGQAGADRGCVTSGSGSPCDMTGKPCAASTAVMTGGLKDFVVSFTDSDRYLLAV